MGGPKARHQLHHHLLHMLPFPAGLPRQAPRHVDGQEAFLSSSSYRARGLFTTAISSSKAKINRALRAMQATLPCKNVWSPGPLFHPVTGTSVFSGCWSGPRRAARADRRAGREEETPYCAERALAAVEFAVAADVVAENVESRRCLDSSRLGSHERLLSAC